MDAGLPRLEFEAHGRIAPAVAKTRGNRASSGTKQQNPAFHPPFHQLSRVKSDRLLASDSRVRTLERLENDIVKALAWLRSADQFMTYPIDRAPKTGAEDTTETTRQLGNRIADAAFRIYANCDECVLLHSLSFNWLPKISKAQRETLIDGALQRKIGQYERRIPNEDYAGADLYGTWIVARDIDPPWMTA
jgi:hypothetical protein